TTTIPTAPISARPRIARRKASKIDISLRAAAEAGASRDDCPVRPRLRTQTDEFLFPPKVRVAVAGTAIGDPAVSERETQSRSRAARGCHPGKRGVSIRPVP